MKNKLLKLGLGPIVITLVIFSGCGGTTSNESQPANKAPTTKEVRSSADVVAVQAKAVGVTAPGKADVEVLLSVSPTYHVNANPATFSYLIATEVMATGTEGITTDKPVYPVGEKKSFQFANEPLSVYEGQVHIKLPLSVGAETSRGSHSLPIKVRVQACDTEKCFPPDTLSATITVEVK